MTKLQQTKSKQSLSKKMSFPKQTSFLKPNWKHQFSHGGELRKKRKGRGQRPLSCKEPLHVVFKINKSILRHHSLRASIGLRLTNKIIKKYAAKFFIKLEQFSIQNDHVHLLIRTSIRSQFHHFFRVVAGQIAQQFQKEGLVFGAATGTLNNAVTDTPIDNLKAGGKTKKQITFWKHRPFSRVVRGYKAYKIVRDYIQLNEMEVLKKIKYQIKRLKGLSMCDWNVLWK